MARNSVHVNARYNVRVLNAQACEDHAMKEGWLDRLIELIQNDERSLNALSIQGKFGRNYIQQMIKERKTPGVDKLERLLNLFSERDSFYVLTGHKLDEDGLTFLTVFSDLPKQTQEDAIRLFRTVLTATDKAAHPADYETRQATK